MTLCVATLVATYRRPRELARLLESLSQIESGLGLVIIIDNAADAETRAVAERARCPVALLTPGENLGCGGGLRRAGEEALRVLGERLTHVLVLDDDAVLPADLLQHLVSALDREDADAAYPLVVDAQGRVGWVPGIRAAPRLDLPPDITADELRRTFQNEWRELVWAQGVCLLVSRRAVEAIGFHRHDFWVRGEDLEFSLRLTARFRAVFVPEVVVQHLPPPETSAISKESAYLKHCAMLQNIAYLSLRLPHGRRIAWTLPANIWRLLRAWSWRALPDIARAIWRGAVRAEPAGAGAGRTFRERYFQRHTEQTK